MPKGDQDHSGIAVTVPAELPGLSHQTLDLTNRQILAPPD
jgi:hypothetical protein